MDGGRGDTKQLLRFQTTAFQGCLYVIIQIYQYNICIYIIYMYHPFLGTSKSISPTKFTNTKSNPTHHHLRNSPSFWDRVDLTTSTFGRSESPPLASLRRSWGGLCGRCQRAGPTIHTVRPMAWLSAFRIIKCAQKVVKVFPPAFRIQQGGSKF